MKLNVEGKSKKKKISQEKDKNIAIKRTMTKIGLKNECNKMLRDKIAKL
jgi:hypothetical protein